MSRRSRLPTPSVPALAVVPLVLLLGLLLSACGRPQPTWALTDVGGHLPDLEFTLTGDDGKPLHGRDLRGKVVLLYFGYTHCPDVCPLAMTRLHLALQRLGASAGDVRIVFVSVDPARDTPALLHRYVRAFDPRAIGATGTPATLRALAKRYRVAFELQPPGREGGYEVTHSSAVFVFDRDGHARLLAASADDTDALVHDITQLLEETP